MNKAEHMAAARSLMAGAEVVKATNSRLAGEGIWGALCEASSALWRHPDRMDHSNRARIGQIKKIMNRCARRRLLSAADLKTLQTSVIPLHDNFYTGAMNEIEFEAHNRIGVALVAKMLSVAERE